MQKSLYSIDLAAFKIAVPGIDRLSPPIHCFWVLNKQGVDIAQYHWYATDTEENLTFFDKILLPFSQFIIPKTHSLPGPGHRVPIGFLNRHHLWPHHSILNDTFRELCLQRYPEAPIGTKEDSSLPIDLRITEVITGGPEVEELWCNHLVAHTQKWRDLNLPYPRGGLLGANGENSNAGCYTMGTLLDLSVERLDHELNFNGYWRPGWGIKMTPLLETSEKQEVTSAYSSQLFSAPSSSASTSQAKLPNNIPSP